MKLFKIVGFALAALSCVHFAEAQQAAKLTAVVQAPGAKPGVLTLERSDGEGTFFYMPKGTDQLMQARASACGMFVIQTPADMAKALRDYYGGDYADARKGFAAVKKKYAHLSGLPGSPGTMAALYELVCAARMLDIPAVKTLSASIPGEKVLNPVEKGQVEAAKVLALVDDTPESFAAIQKAVVALAKTTGVRLDSEAYGWTRYALGRAAAATMAVANDKTKSANAAIDFYCQAAMSMHGAQKTVPADAIKRAMNLLWNLPDVQAYASKAPKPMDKKEWFKAPANFRDAVAMAHYYKTVYETGTPDPLATQLDAYYYNQLKGVKKGD